MSVIKTNVKALDLIIIIQTRVKNLFPNFYIGLATQACTIKCFTAVIEQHGLDTNAGKQLS